MTRIALDFTPFAALQHQIDENHRPEPEPEPTPPVTGQTIHLAASDVPEVFKRCFPGYTGRTYRVVTTTAVTFDSNYWSGGTKSDYRGLDLETGRVFEPPQEYGTQFTGDTPTVELVPGVAIVEHVRFCGKDHGIRIHCHPENIQKLLPSPTELTDNERSALDLLCSIKGGKYRRDHWSRYSSLPGKYSAENPLIVSLATKGMVKINKAGAVSITLDGRNARR